MIYASKMKILQEDLGEDSKKSINEQVIDC
jgi:hypothetical protein